MYVRIARLEGAEDNWDERIEQIARRMRGENGRGAGLVFFGTEEHLRRVDAEPGS